MLQVFQPPAADPEAFDVVIRRPDGTEEIWKRHVSDSEAATLIGTYNSVPTGHRAYMCVCRCRWPD